MLLMLSKVTNVHPVIINFNQPTEYETNFYHEKYEEYYLGAVEYTDCFSVEG